MPEQSRKKLLVTWRPRANNQWNKILTFFAKRNQSNAYSEKLDAELDHILELLSIDTELGQKTKQRGIRRFTFANYALFYRVKKDSLEVTAIVDTRRNVKWD